MIAGEYATGVAPIWRGWNPGDDPSALVKIDAPHWADDRIAAVVRTPAIGEWAAAITGAAFVQVWAAQLLHKPPSPATGHVGWHQDDTYWKPWWAGEVFTCWLALSDVPAEAGPLLFIPGSHRWGAVGGDFFSADMEGVRSQIAVPAGADWIEVPAILEPGAASFHDRHLVHGSSPNLANHARRSIAIHLRTERSEVLDPTSPYLVDLHDPTRCPVLYER